MRIGLDASLHDGGRSGVGRYILSLLKGLAAAPDGTEYVVFRPARDRGPLPDAPHLRYVELPAFIRSPVADVLWHQTRLGGRARALGLDCMHFLEPRRAVRGLPCPTVATVHDLAPLHVAGKYDPARMLYQRRVIPALLRGQDRLIADSHATAEDLIRVGVARERTHVIPLGVDHDRYFPWPLEEARARVREGFGVAAPFLLYVARLEHPGKNHLRLLRAFGAIGARRPEIVLVLAGPEWSGHQAIYRETGRLGLAGRVIFTGYVGDDQLPFLYRAAEALVFPSLFEGFGLPLLEAMACGTPVVTSNVSSMPEVVGDAGLLVDPTSEADIARGIEEALADAATGAELARKGLARARAFTWERTARETRAVHRLAVGLPSGGATPAGAAPAAPLGSVA